MGTFASMKLRDATQRRLSNIEEAVCLSRTWELCISFRTVTSLKARIFINAAVRTSYLIGLCRIHALRSILQEISAVLTLFVVFSVHTNTDIDTAPYVQMGYGHVLPQNAILRYHLVILLVSII